MDIRISIDSMICHGHACLKGSRIPVHQYLDLRTSCDSLEGLLQGNPALTLEDILAFFGYGEALPEEQVKPLDLM